MDQNGWFIPWEIPSKMDDWGGPLLIHGNHHHMIILSTNGIAYFTSQYLLMWQGPPGAIAD